ncbi:MAG: hypothetical protein Q8M76_06670, partial [Spirochaetaceae bacterium]|nr:hypothetical protein [Spirochaetaceae bacterium]
VADTVRDESRIYPRPTDIRVFSEEPFSLRESAVMEIVGRLELHPEGADIRSCRASNRALYLYSSIHLDPNLAQSQAEWIEVGQKENP